MSTFFANQDRKVIPNFRNLKKTIQLGELNSEIQPNISFIKANLDEYIKEFSINRTLAHAGDLISAATVNNNFESNGIKDAAKFILENKHKSTESQQTLANKILKIKTGFTPIQNIDSIEEFLQERTLISNRISALKKIRNGFSHNPFIYSELARLYSIIGRKDFAIKNIIISKGLAPNNRYVLRSFARLMAHYGDVDQAHDSLKKNIFTKRDPWLLASEIAFASLRGKTSNLIKEGYNLINSGNYHPFNLSELASSIGTVEFLNGNRKKSLNLFSTALISPNDNSLAQIEWANNRGGLFDLDVNKFSVQNSYEAETLGHFNDDNWVKTIENAEKWFIDMPFAKRPIMFAAHAAGFYLENQETAIKFCKAGLISNPNDPQIINNISYSYALNNEPDNALTHLSKVDINMIKDDEVNMCLLATKGLAFYRLGDYHKGREYYAQAMKQAINKNKKYYYAMALMHLTREEMQLKTPESEMLYNQTLGIDEGDSGALTVMKKRIIGLKEK